MAPTRSAAQRRRLEELSCDHPNAAGLDIGSEEIVVAVPPDRDAAPVRVYRTFTPYLVNARHVKTVPGRKSDWNDAQWLQKLHTLGLLQGSFRPDAEIRALRALARHRGELIRHRAPHILHMQQTLKVMNIQLSIVLSDITGETGQAIVRAIVAGERDAATLADLRHPKRKATVGEIEKALTGTWQEAQLFILQQGLELFDFYTAQLAACDREMERMYQAIEARGEPNAALPDLPRAKPGSKSKNEPNFNVRAQLARIVGVDLAAVMGLSVQPSMSESVVNANSNT